MSECGNMQDWHPYNPPSGGRPSAPSGAQNSTTGHMFISSISPPTMDGMNLTSERHQTSKHQNDASYVSRTYAGPPLSGSNCSTSSSLPSGVHMTPLSTCVSHYGGSSTRNAMIESLNTTMDPRMGPVTSINDEVAHRNSQMAFPNPPNHPNPQNLNVNAGPATIQNSPIGPMSPGRQGGFGTCKAPCCHPDANIPYQHWEKYGHYHGAPGAPSSYRENIRQTTYPPVDNRRYMPDMNIRKDCLDKDLAESTPFPVEHRRNSDYKYGRKDSVVSRMYPAQPNGMMQNYTMQNYNFPNDYQKCPYTVKDYMRRGSGAKNSSMLKYQEQQGVIVPPKYPHAKQMQYQNGTVLPNPTNSGNLPSSLQNSYYNAPQIPRDLSRDYARDYSQEQTANRMPQVPPTNSHVHSSFQKYHAYHQKIAMQRYSVENHLRAFSRIPGYQSHPKYQECVMRYRELLRLQQTVDYQNVLQEAPKVPSPSSAAPQVAPINLQFDQNGILINSNYIPGNYTGIHGNVNTMTNTENSENSSNNRIPTNATNLEAQNQFIDHNLSMNLTRDLENQINQNPVRNLHESNERYFINEKNNRSASYEVERLRNVENLDPLVDVDGTDAAKTTGQNINSSTTSASMPIVPTEAMNYKKSKDFANKPELDVRQFLANWDESEEEDAASTNVAASQFENNVFPSKNHQNTDEPTNLSNDKISETNDSSVATNGSNLSPLSETTSEIDIETTEHSPRNNCDNISSTKEITCIRTDDGDEIPTIHIVDNLESGTDLEKIHKVFGSLASSVLNPISIGESSSVDGTSKGETIVLFEQENGVCTKTLEFSVAPEGNNSEIVEGVIASIIESTTIEKSSDNPELTKKLPEATDSSTVEQNSTSVSNSSTTSTPTSCSSKTLNTETVDTNLRKQNSFASDESHNPDDISLPDLQTSECTPISTTLNTPIQSDNEESSEHVTDLTISTNPIEIIQNSPIISFTHSPIKIEPYEQLDGRMGRPSRRRSSQQLERHDSLDFDFDREVAAGENTKYTSETSETSATSGVEGLETEETRAEDSLLLADIQQTGQSSYNDKQVEAEREVEFYRTADPLVGMANISKNSEKDNCDEEICQTKDSNENVENCESPVDRILDIRSDELDTDKCPSIMERDDDFNRSSDLEKLCDMSLDDSCMMPLISSDDCDVTRIPVATMETGHCFTKMIDEALPIVDLNVLTTSASLDDGKLGKPDEDMWGDVRYMDKHLDANSSCSVLQKDKNDAKKINNVSQSDNEKSSPMKSKHHEIDTSQNESTYKPCNLSESDEDSRDASPEQSRESVITENSQKDKTPSISSTEPQKSSKDKIIEENQETEEPRKNRDAFKRRSSREEKYPEENSQTTDESDDDPKTPIAKTYTTKHRESNVEIQVANFNVKIHDNELIRKETIGKKLDNQESSSDGLDAIEIKINLSRSDVNRRGNKQLQDSPDPRDSSPQRENGTSKKCCRRRRRSMPDGFESKRSKRTEEEKEEISEYYTAKKISKRNSGNRKIRRSMDDELLLNSERSSKEFAIGERNFHLEMAQAFNLPWPREEDQENCDSSSSILPKEDKKSLTRTKGDSRSEKQAKETKTVPSPSYNSALDNSSTLDFDNFDVAPHKSSDTDPEQGDSLNESRYSRIKRTRLEDRERYINPSSYGSSFDELASLDAFEINLNTVPIYTTKDGRITYSPNRNYTYRALIMEARQREGYPTLRKLHYPRQSSSRNHYREATMRKLYKRRQEERSGHDKKRRGSDYHVGKSKRPVSTRHHIEETETRLAMRSKNHDNRRRETRIPLEMELCSDDQSRDDCKTNKNRSIEALASSYKPETHGKIIQPQEESPIVRRNENSRKDDLPDNSRSSMSNYKANIGMKNVIDDFSRSPKHFTSHETDNCLVSTIFQGQELEISSRKISPGLSEHNERQDCGRTSRFFPQSSHSLKTPMASPLINLEKRPTGWDLEQDCQTALSDSGLESSTTYVEASKESRRIQRWKNSFLGGSQAPKTIYNTPNDTCSEAIDLSHEKMEAEKNNHRYFDDEPSDHRIKENETKIRRLEIVSCEILVPARQILEVDDSKKLPEDIEKSVEIEKKRINEESTILKSLDDDSLKNNRMSEIVKSLDLAITHRHRLSLKETKINNEIPIKIDDNNDEAKPAASIFRYHREALDCLVKTSETLSRRASSDAVESRDYRNDFFRVSTISEITENESKITTDEIEEPEFFNDEPENQDSQTAMSENIGRVPTPENFQNRCKDFLIDTSTSFSSCMKLPEPISALATESENSQHEDTSTRFASESMDFKDVQENSDSLKSNFMPFASHGVINASILDNDTSGRDSFFAENAMNAINPSEDCTIEGKNVFQDSIEKSDSDCRSTESSVKAPILSFSGQIQSDSRNTDSPSKSPPNLSCEDSIPKLVIKKSDSSTKISLPLETSFDTLTRDSEKKFHLVDQDLSSHPKIPKMIIRNVRSRPGTPTAIEEDEETRNSSRDQKLFEVEIKLDKDSSPRETECKIPKMKIKLEDKQQSRIILETAKTSNLEVVESKNVPKVKIRKIRRASTSRSPIRAGKLPKQSSETENQPEFQENLENSNVSSSYKFTLIEKPSSKSHNNQTSKTERNDDDSKQDRIPKLTIKKQEVNSAGSSYSSSQTSKKRRSRSPGESGSKKQRKNTSRHSSSKRDESRSRERRTNSLDSNENTDSQSLSAKIPKVIIKRTSPSAEFKCELSKVGREAITKDSKWQPEVKLQRSWVLDCMAKEPGSGKVALKMLSTTNVFSERKTNDESSRKHSDWKRSTSDSKSRKYSSNSDGKARRRSDCDLNKNQSRYEEDKRSRASLIGNNRSKSFDDNIDDRRNSLKNEITDSHFKCNALPASTKLKEHHEFMDKIKINSNKKEEKQDKKDLDSTRLKNESYYDEPETSVIKLDSSDESQTTIELLLASPDNSQPESSLDLIDQSSEVERCIGNGSMGKLYSDEAIPTQFELELEIVDNSTIDSLDVPIPLPDESSIEEDSTGEIVPRLERYKSFREDVESLATDLGCEKFVYNEDTTNVSSKKSHNLLNDDTKTLCCSDSLVKEVLAAKETLKRCLTRSKSIVKPRSKPRTKTAAEKKQGSGFDFVRLAEYAKTSKCNVEERAVFHNTVRASKIEETIGCCSESKSNSENSNNDKRQSKHETKSRESSEKHDKYRKSWSGDNRQSERSKEEHKTSSSSSKRPSLPSINVSPMKSGKSIEHESYGENSRSKCILEKSSKSRSFKTNEKSSEQHASKVSNSEDTSKKSNSYKIPKISRSREKSTNEEAVVTEDKRESPSPTKMPVLEPQIDLGFELVGSDRDTSRSPPTITKQENPEIDNELPKKLEENVNSDKLDSITKQQGAEAVTFADIVSQLAYHEKATIRHRRYCNLCERWFPSTIRHERHLSGYQHRHTELTQRRTIHALFMLFTGKPCPRLLPASIVRTDCLPGEPTPLQIAVQDVAISLEDGARLKPNKDVSSKDE